MDIFTNEDHIYYDQIDDRIADLLAEISERIQVLAQNNLTPTQLNVFNLMLNGESQTNIAAILYTSPQYIHEIINGHTVYTGKYKGNTYGGLIKKLKSLAKKDKIIRQNWQKIAKIKKNIL